MKKLVIFAIVVIILICLAVYISKNNSENQTTEQNQTVENNVKQMDSLNDDTLTENIVIGELASLKDCLIESDLLNPIKEMSKKEIKEAYGFDNSNNCFVLSKKSNENHIEVCVVEIENSGDKDDIIFSLIRRYNNLMFEYEEKGLNNIINAEMLSIKKRGNIAFLIISKNAEEIENLIEKEYLDK